MKYLLYVFGSNGEGQLGIPSRDIVDTPTVAQVWTSNPRVKSLCSGDNHTIILTEFHEIWGTGTNRKGQLDNSSFKGFEKIVSLGSNTEICAAACESSAVIATSRSSTCDTQRILRTRGAGPWGELGTGETTDSAEGKGDLEIDFPYPDKVADLAAGGWHYVALLADGSIYGWGKSRLDQLGPKFSPRQRVTVPTLVEEPIPFKVAKVVCGKEFTYLASDPSTGQHYLLGRDKFSLRSNMPSHIQYWKDIGATWNAIFVLFPDGSLIAWGKENMWKLVPDDLPPIDSIAVGSDHVLAVTKKGKLISWGWGKHGNCGNLEGLSTRVKNGMVTGFWNEIELPGKIEFVGAGFCTSFVLTKSPEQDRESG